MRQSFARALLALLTVNVATIWSCGGGNDGTPGATTPPSTSTVTPGAPGAGGAPGVGSSSPGTGSMPTTPTPTPTTITPSTGTTAPGTSAPATTSTVTGTPDAGAPPTTGTTPSGAGATLVPLYTPPGDPSWGAVIAGKQAHPRVRVVAVVNPANGPGASQTQAYADGITRLTNAGVVVLGYVATGYTARSEAAVDADIAHWKSFYPQIGGIFFDEQSNRAGDEAHYQHLVQYARDMGLPFTVGNPGQDTSESFVGVFDMMLIYENKGVPSAAALGGWHAKYAPSNFGVIPYGAPMDTSFVQMARQHVGYVYINNDTLPNPWDTVPPYFNDLLAALE